MRGVLLFEEEMVPVFVRFVPAVFGVVSVEEVESVETLGLDWVEFDFVVAAAIVVTVAIVVAGVGDVASAFEPSASEFEEVAYVAVEFFGLEPYYVSDLVVFGFVAFGFVAFGFVALVLESVVTEGPFDLLCVIVVIFDLSSVGLSEVVQMVELSFCYVVVGSWAQSKVGLVFVVELGPQFPVLVGSL
jgi:hypothetical protein